MLNLSKQSEEAICTTMAFILGKYNIPENSVDTGNDLNKQNFEDTTWYKRLYPLKKLGVSNIFNISPNINISEESGNKAIIRDNYLEAVIGDAAKTKNYYALFTATDKNIVFAAISLSGDLYFVLEALKLIFNNSSEEEFNGLLEKTCKYTDKVSNLSKRNINSDVLKSDLISYLLVDLCIKLGSGFFDFENNIKRLEYIINDALKSLFRSEADSPTLYNLLLNQNDMYRTIINKFMTNQDQIERRAMERGILIGSKFFTGFQRAGYIYDIDTGRWEKKVSIHPEYCLWGDALYQIPEKFRDKFFVETISFDPNTLREENFVLNAKGAHPNVGGSGQICIGTVLLDSFKRLIRNKGLMVQEYVNFLIKVEEALKVINFDSAFYDFHKATGEQPSKVLIRADALNNSSSSTTIRGSLKRV